MYVGASSRLQLVPALGFVTGRLHTCCLDSLERTTKGCSEVFPARRNCQWALLATLVLLFGLFVWDEAQCVKLFLLLQMRSTLELFMAA